MDTKPLKWSSIEKEIKSVWLAKNMEQLQFLQIVTKIWLLTKIPAKESDSWEKLFAEKIIRQAYYKGFNDCFQLIIIPLKVLDFVNIWIKLNCTKILNKRSTHAIF